MNPQHAAKVAEREGIKRELATLDESLAKMALDLNIRILHLNPYTFAYWGDPKMNILYVANALCNPNDCYSKKEGRRQALIAFNEDRYITLYKPKEIQPQNFLIQVFGQAQASHPKCPKGTFYML